MNQMKKTDDELCFVDSLKQEAFDDKVDFDNDEIFNNVSFNFWMRNTTRIGLCFRHHV